MTEAQNDILEIARERGLIKIHVIHNKNYQRDMEDYGVIGFDTFEDVKKFATENNCDVVEFEIREGKRSWSNKGAMHQSFLPADYLNKLGDDYSIVDADYKQVCDLDGNYDRLETFIFHTNKIKDALDQAGENECVITYQGQYFKTVKKQMIEYSHDTHEYTIGILVKSDKEEK